MNRTYCEKGDEWHSCTITAFHTEPSLETNEERLGPQAVLGIIGRLVGLESAANHCHAAGLLTVDGIP